MTEQEIIDGNKLIAEFMGGKDDSRTYGLEMGLYWKFNTPLGVAIDWDDDDSAYLSYNETKWAFEDMQFHTSWDWLMPVVEKINRLGLDSKKFMIDIGQSGADYLSDLAAALATVNIETSWFIVTKLIKWYNENKPSTLN